jgi:hypothetical protein
VPNILADHYTKLESVKQSRTGLIFNPKPHIIHIPKNIQIQQGHIARKYTNFSKRFSCLLFMKHTGIQEQFLVYPCIF